MGRFSSPPDHKVNGAICEMAPLAFRLYWVLEVASRLASSSASCLRNFFGSVILVSWARRCFSRRGMSSRKSLLLYRAQGVAAGKSREMREMHAAGAMLHRELPHCTSFR